jgi:hypothetical protein
MLLRTGLLLELLDGLIPTRRPSQETFATVGALATWVIGFAAMLCESLRCSGFYIIAVRILFTLAACITIWIALMPMERASAVAHPLDLELSARLVSRWAYILIYSLAIARIGMSLCESAHITGIRGSSMRPPDDFLFYVAACIVPLWTIRAAVLLHQRSGAGQRNNNERTGPSPAPASQSESAPQGNHQV